MEPNGHRGLRSLDRAVDAALAGGLALLNVMSLHFPDPAVAYSFPRPTVWQTALVVLASLALYWRRERAVAVYLFVVGATFVVGVPGLDTAMLPVVIIFALYSLAAWTSLRTAVAGLLLLYAVMVVLALRAVPYFDGPWALLTPVAFTVFWASGLVMRSSRAARDLALQRALETERNRALALAEARVQERLRVARDLHDVLAHTLSVVSVQAGLARRLVPSRPDEATAAIERVEACAREATADLRRILGVLRVPAEGPVLVPQPGLSELRRLVEEEGAARLLTSGDPDAWTEGLRTTVFRIVQECLTNARRHAPGGDVVVHLREDDGHAHVVVSSGPPRLAADWQPAPPPSAAQPPENGTEPGAAVGWGLVGLRERVESLGGSFHAGRAPDGRFEVRAVL